MSATLPATGGGTLATLSVPPEPRYCVNCRHFEPNPMSAGEPLCLHRCGQIDLVTGKPQRRYCSVEREFACGREARNFQPKD